MTALIGKEARLSAGAQGLASEKRGFAPDCIRIAVLCAARFGTRPSDCLIGIPGLRLLLAPMEGLLDDVLRAVLTATGGYDYAVTEFARVSGTLLPERFFRRLSPELQQGSRTVGGTPVRVQLLGSDPACMGRMPRGSRHWRRRASTSTSAVRHRR
ncbi:tRNA-dihydrouridine synthase [Thauera humireducens]|uniref:tRNA-dihydrouridine synthase n=1 Tax=Thauera humireducens TaxID=1134435 RepID=UPI00311DB4F5